VVNLARGLERRLEAIVEGLAAKLFRGSVQPVELANRLIRAADLAVFEGPAGPTVPNLYGVRMSPDDLGAAEAPQEFRDELASAIEETAYERGWRFDGIVVVEIAADAAMKSGALDIATSTVPTALSPWAYLVPRGGAERLPVRPNRAVVGRGDNADVVVSRDSTSRSHALLWREAGTVWVADLGSGNGTLHNGRLIEGPEEVANGDVLTFGEAQFIFRPASA
jgi:hypothetical protein